VELTGAIAGGFLAGTQIMNETCEAHVVELAFR
jgi:hypothetical protein